jgi:hypothetical protein
MVQIRIRESHTKSDGAKEVFKPYVGTLSEFRRGQSTNKYGSRFSFIQVSKVAKTWRNLVVMDIAWVTPGYACEGRAEIDSDQNSPFCHDCQADNPWNAMDLQVNQ